MKYAVPILLAAILLGAAPALAQEHVRDGGRGQWRGAQAAEGNWRAGRGDGRGEGGWRGRNEGPWRGRGEDAPPEGRLGRAGDGPLYAEPPREGRTPNSLGAGWRQQQDEARDRVRRGELRSLPNVIDGIRRRQPGRQLDAGIEAWGDGRPTYRVRWAAANGRRIDYIVDARTGAILAVEGR